GFLWAVTLAVCFAFFFTYYRIVRAVATKIDTWFVIIFRSQFACGGDTRQYERRPAAATYLGSIRCNNAVTVSINNVLVHTRIIITGRIDLTGRQHGVTNFAIDLVPVHVQTIRKRVIRAELLQLSVNQPQQVRVLKT